MDCTNFEQYLPNENHSQKNNLNYFQISLKINSLEGQKVLDKAFIMSYNILILNNKRIKTL
jgi:hypothetical protein